MTIVVGLDVGTSGLKAVAVQSETGGVVACASRDYPLATPRPGWAEQEPEDFAQAAVSALGEIARAVGKRKIHAIGLTGQMHSAVLLDETRTVVRPAILWCDTRTTDECRIIEDRMGGLPGLARTVGNRALEGFTLPKLLWVRRHEPARFDRVRAVLMPKDFVALRLTGELGTDVSDASGTLAFDPARRGWSEEIVRALELRRDMLPPVGEASDVLGGLTPEAAEATGLARATPVVRGAADNAAGAVGLGVVAEGRVMVSIGTSGVVLAHADRHVVDPAMRLHAFCHAVSGRWVRMGVMLAAGGALRWYRDVLCDGEKFAADMRQTDPYEVVTDAASTSRPGAGGVLFLPYLMGERTPHNDSSARGAIVGLSAATTKADVSRAVLEGITFGLADALDRVRDEGIDPSEVRLTGGGARSAFWRQLCADVFGVDVTLTSSTEGPAFGAAILAGAGTGIWGSVEEGAEAIVHVTARIAPTPQMPERYREIHEAYRGLYSDLRGRFAALARLG